MNLGEIRAEIRRIVQDTNTDTTQQKWSDTVIDSRINQSHEQICAMTKCMKETYTANLVAGTAEYTLPDYLISIDTALYLNSDSVYVPIERKTEKELDIENANWRSLTSSTPEAYYVRDNVIGLAPYPDTAKTNGLRLYTSRKPYSATSADDDSLADDADIPFGGATELYPFHDILIYDVAKKCKLDSREFDEAKVYDSLVNQILARIRSQVSEDNTETRLVNIYESIRSSSRRSR